MTTQGVKGPCQTVRLGGHRTRKAMAAWAESRVLHDPRPLLYLFYTHLRDSNHSNYSNIVPVQHHAYQIYSHL